MSTTTTLAAYATALALVFGAAVGVGSAVGPVGTASGDSPRHGGQDHSSQDDSGQDHSPTTDEDTR